LTAEIDFNNDRLGALKVNLKRKGLSRATFTTGASSKLIEDARIAGVPPKPGDGFVGYGSAARYPPVRAHSFR
jgi:hypothetical protein